MENAAKALEIAAGVLLAVIIMSLIAYFFTQLGVWPQEQEKVESAEQLARFNKEYTVYEKSAMYGVDVISCLNKAKSNNEKYAEGGSFFTGAKYEEKGEKNNYYIDVYVNINSPLKESLEIYYMNKENIPIPVATVILMVVTITYKLVLVVIGVGILLFGQGFLHQYLEEILPVYYLGLLLNVFCVSFMTVLVFHPVLAEKIILTGMDWLEKLHLMKKKQSRREKFQASMEVYRETAAYLKDHKRVIVSVILITFIQRLALFAVTWMVYLAFRLEGTPMWDVVLLQAVISVSVDMLPLPGGMGISESLFLKIFTTVFASVTLPAMVLSRGLGYYSQLLISALFTIVAQLYYSVHKSKVPHRCSTLDTEE